MKEGFDSPRDRHNHNVFLNMKFKTFYLHIGYPKTATSFIRESVINTEGYLYLGKSKKKPNFLNEIFTSLIYTKNDHLFLNKLKSSNIKMKFNNFVETSSSKHLFYSEENILNFTPKVDIMSRIKRIKLFIDELNYKNTKILVTIRDPLDLLLSNISQNVLYFMYLNKINFENIKNDYFIKSYLNFDELKLILEKIFKAENIMFLDYNDLIKNNILNLEINSSSSKIVNKSIKFKTKNFSIHFCKIKLRDIIRKYMSNRNSKMMFKKIYFNLKNLILYFDNRDLAILRDLFINKKTFTNSDKISFSKTRVPPVK